jgi:enoyl-CoA hydratase
MTIDNQSKLNALSRALMDQFVVEAARLADLNELRVVVVTGAGHRAFVGGADIREMAALQTPQDAREFIGRVHSCCNAVRSMPVPVIARIQGFAFGAGLELAASCDLRVASEAAMFGMPEVKLGIPSVVEAALLPALIGWGRTRELVFLGEAITAREALRWNLVERVVEPAALDATVEDLITKIMACGPRAIRLQKSLLRSWEDLPTAAAIAAGIDVFAAAFETSEPTTAMSEFLARQAKRNRNRPQ